MAKEKKVNPLLNADEPEEETSAESEPVTAQKATVAPTASKEEKVPTQTKVTSGNVQSALLSDAENTRRTLAKEKKVFFMIPLSPFEKEGAFDEVYINGYRTTIKKGVMVEVPESVMRLLANKYNIETELGREFRVDRNDKTQDALG